jgi:hypothetical protein
MMKNKLIAGFITITTPIWVPMAVTLAIPALVIVSSYHGLRGIYEDVLNFLQ